MREAVLTLWLLAVPGEPALVFTERLACVERARQMESQMANGVRCVTLAPPRCACPGVGWSDPALPYRVDPVPDLPPRTAHPVPEPGGLALFAAGLFGLFLTRHAGATSSHSRPFARLRRIASLLALHPHAIRRRDTKGNAAVAGNRIAAKAMTRAAALALGAAMLLGAGAAFAHQAPSGWEYHGSCCSKRDCAQAPRFTVRALQDGWSVSVQPGTHPMVPEGEEPLHAFVPRGDGRVMDSGDGWFHVCVSPWRDLLCLYVPIGGA